MRILVLGGYGLIGAAVVRRLLDAGHEVVGLGRTTATARLKEPKARWITADISRLATAADWQPILRDARPDMIVNCAGALQDSARDDVAALQSVAMQALYAAASACSVRSLVQISAPRADRNEATRFMQTKGEADAALQKCALDWTILRPGLVLSPQAYGGSALLRALAAVPWVLPLCYADSAIQTVDVSDVAEAVLAVARGSVPTRRIYDLVEDQSHTLLEITTRLRSWFGLPDAKVLHAPSGAALAFAKLADMLGWFGWRSAARTTAIRELSADVVGDPRPWREATGASLRSFDATLERMPSTVQDLWFARLYLLKPLVIGTLAIFWFLSGLIACFQFDAAVEVLTRRGYSANLAEAFVMGGIIFDLLIGCAALFRRTIGYAAIAMICVTVAYLIGGTMLAPDLWLDPLGPLLKTLPGLVLALVALAIAVER